MKKLIALALAVVSFNAAAAKWVEIYRDDIGVRYIDASSIGKKSNTPTIWVKVEYTNPTDNIHKLLLKTRINCDQETYKVLVAAQYDEKGNRLFYEDDFEERTVIPDTVMSLDKNLACTAFRN